MNIGKFDDNIHTEYFNGKGYKVNAILFNDDGQVYKLRFGAVEELVIQDSLLNWTHRGSITIKNPHNAIERNDRVYTAQGHEEIPQFRFRSDGRDYLYLHLEPLIDDTELAGINQDTYTIKLIFSIYKIEDNPTGDAQSKTKTLHFWDYRYQYMVEKNLRWSTSYAIKSRSSDSDLKVSQMSNSDRSINCGEALMELLDSTFGEDFGDITFDPGWDPGSRPVFYSSPNEYKIVDDVQYILDQTVSAGETGNNPCILRLERTQGHEWSLRSLPDYFKNSTEEDGSPGPLQSELFLISSLPDNGNPIPNRPKAPKGGNTVLNVHLPHTSEIEDFEFVQQPGLLNQRRMVTTAVNGYSYHDKSFTTYQYNIDDMEKDFQSNIVDLAYSSGSSNCHANFFVNKMKLNNHNVRSILSNTSTDISATSNGRNRIIHNGLLTGNTMHFTVKGNTNRQAGRFIGIDRSGNYDENTYDDMTLGQYFTVEVHHVFSSNLYSNEIIAVKPFSFTDQKYNKDVL
jgi:hypothetical protein